MAFRKFLTLLLAGVGLSLIAGCSDESPISPGSWEPADIWSQDDAATQASPEQVGALSKVINGKEVVIRLTSYPNSDGTNKVYYSVYTLNLYGSLTQVVAPRYIDNFRGKPSISINQSGTVIMAGGCLSGSAESVYLWLGRMNSDYTLSWTKTKKFLFAGVFHSAQMNDKGAIMVTYADPVARNFKLAAGLAGGTDVSIKNTYVLSTPPYLHSWIDVSINSGNRILLAFGGGATPQNLPLGRQPTHQYYLVAQLDYVNTTWRGVTIGPLQVGTMNLHDSPLVTATLNDANEFIVAMKGLDSKGYFAVGRLGSGTSAPVTWITPKHLMPNSLVANDVSMVKYGHISDTFYCGFSYATTTSGIMIGKMNSDGLITQQTIIASSGNQTVSVEM